MLREGNVYVIHNLHTKYIFLDDLLREIPHISSDVIT